MNTRAKKIIEKILERLKPLNPEKIILFGSYAYGNPAKDSDLDLIVVTRDEFMPQNFKENSEVYLRVARQLRDMREEVPIDLIVFTKPMYETFIKLRSMFAEKVLKEGIELL